MDDKFIAASKIRDFGDAERKDLMIKAAICYKIVVGNISDAYRVYNLGYNKREKIKANNSSNASSFFKRDDIDSTYQILLNKVKNKLVIEHLSSLGITKNKIDKLLKSKDSNYESNDFDLSLESLTDKLTDFMSKPDINDSTYLGAVKLISDLHALKKQNTNDGKDNIVYFLPMKLCDSCEHKNEIISKYSDDAYFDIEKDDDNKIIEDNNIEIEDNNDEEIDVFSGIEDDE